VSPGDLILARHRVHRAIAELDSANPIVHALYVLLRHTPFATA
jgi:hypothetical protein